MIALSVNATAKRPSTVISKSAAPRKPAANGEKLTQAASFLLSLVVGMT
jgi:hypothetical protein